MKKTLLKSFWLRTLMLVAIVLFGTSNSWGQTSYKLEQVTSVETGGLYVFEQTYNGTGYVMNNTVSNSTLQTTTSYLTTGLSGTETYVWTLETATNGYYLKNVSKTSNQYLNNASSTGVSFGSNNSIWAFNFQTDNTVLIQNTSNSDRFLGFPHSGGVVTTGYKAYATLNLDTYPHAIKVYKLVAASTDPSISASDVNIAYNATSGVINYNINNPTADGIFSIPNDDNIPEWISSFFNPAGSNTVTFSCSPNTGATVRTATITLVYTYNSGANSVTKDITITQASVPYTTIPALFEDVTDTATDVNVTFGGWVVSGVKGNNAYLTDNQGHGLIIFASNHGFKVGDVLTGTAQCKLQIYRGSAEITDLTTSTNGLTVTAGGTVTTVTNISIANLSGVNTGAVFSFENLSFDGTELSDGTNTIKPYTTLFSGTFVSGKSYNVTGVYLQFDDTKEILPRSAEDVVELGDDPIEFNDISGITEVNTGYRVRGTVVATNNKGLVLGDGTGYVYYYKNATVSQSVGDKISIYGNSATYGNILQFTNTATVAEETESNYNNAPAATIITEVPDYTQGYHLSTYLQFEGTLSKDNNSYFITLGDAQIQVSYPTTEQGTALTVLDGKTVLVKGYFTGINSTKKFTVMLESVEEVVSTDPVINAGNVTLSYDATNGEIAYTIDNPVEGTAITATLQEGVDWISAITVFSDKVTFTTTTNDGDADRTATITLAYEGAESVTVTVTQEFFVADYATLPFEFDGGKADIANTSGLTQDELGTDYKEGPKLKFDSTGDYVLLKFNERPGKLTFDIKGNSFSGGTFTVQTSEDGETYTNLESYTELGDTQSESFDNLGENVRYIKWIYTEKSNGNVGLDNIKLEKYDSRPTVSAGTLTGVTSLELWDGDMENIEVGGRVTPGTTVFVKPVLEADYTLETIKATDAAGSPITLTENSGAWSFTMPETNVTINATATIEPIEGDKFVKVTSTADLTNGQYLIVYEAGKLAFNGALETLDAVGNSIAIKIIQNAVAATNEAKAAAFTIDVTNGTIKSGSGLYIGQTSDANGLASSTETAYTNTLSLDEDGNADILSSGGAYLRYNATSGQDRFRYYKSSSYTGQQPIALYKLVKETKTGDVNRDGDVTIADVTALVNIILGKDTEGVYDHEAADVNDDDEITIADVTALVNIILGKN